MKRIAILITCHNRKIKTVSCIEHVQYSAKEAKTEITYKIFLTDDGCTDGTVNEILSLKGCIDIQIIKGDGNLYWNGGMIKAWETAIAEGNFDGYLWLNDDTRMLPAFWTDLALADEVSEKTYGKRGIYVGSTYDESSKSFTYGGFNYLNKWTLKDQFILPNGKDFLPCECAHGNITYISKNVVDKMGILYKGYIHGAGDHDYTHRAHKAGLPVLVMPNYSGICNNDHHKEKQLAEMSFKERYRFMKSPLGFNLHNTLLFQKRCFPYRYIPVLLTSLLKLLFPDLIHKIYLLLRR